MRRFTAQGGKTVVAVYVTNSAKIIPRCFGPSPPSFFRAWREEIVGARRRRRRHLPRYGVKASMRICGASASRPPIGRRPLGSDFDRGEGRSQAVTAVWIATGPAYFLSVGTPEPRKAYPVAIEAFELLWAAGRDIRYVIVGRPGWNTRALRTAPAATPLNSAAACCGSTTPTTRICNCSTPMRAAP